MTLVAEWFSLEEMTALQGACVLTSVWAKEWQYKLSEKYHCAQKDVRLNTASSEQKTSVKSERGPLPRGTES